MSVAEHELRHAFVFWLRTGRVLSMAGRAPIEFKFNPWHDSSNGRFTFVGAGQYFRRASGAPSRSGVRVGVVRSAQPKSVTTGGSSAEWAPHSPARVGKLPVTRFSGGRGGSYGGGGTSGTWGAARPTPRPNNSSSLPTTIKVPDRVAGTKLPVGRPESVSSEQFRTVVRNGYTYEIDSRDRTRRVSGALTLGNATNRSRRSQLQAGGNERRASDDGGHYIAVRFNGPTEAFNHFAQDATFNRGGYRVLEDEWAREKRAGKAVTVRIVPMFDGEAVRPSVINVWWTTNGHKKSQRFPNARPRPSHGG